MPQISGSFNIPSGSYIAGLGIWTVDSTGADIQYLNTTNLSPYFNGAYLYQGAGVIGLASYTTQATIYGNKFWAAHVGANVRTVLGSANQPDRVITAQLSFCGFRTAFDPGGVSGVVCPASMQMFLQGLY